jgi:hypothetical protein
MAPVTGHGTPSRTMAPPHGQGHAGHGGSRGIGRATAERPGRDGARVAVATTGGRPRPPSGIYAPRVRALRTRSISRAASRLAIAWRLS